MNIQYRFASPEGDVPIGSRERQCPFRLSPQKDHPFLTLGDYFESLKHFILEKGREPFIRLLADMLGEPFDWSRIPKMVFRSEKHGALYHIASLEILLPGKSVKLGITAALSERARSLLKDEFTLLRNLRKRHDPPYIPNVYIIRDVPCCAGKHEARFTMALSEWFAGYHEWHVSNDKKRNEERICFWDQERGCRFLSPAESRELMRKAARILTLYYDPKTCRQIGPWHHGAGDFIARVLDGEVDVKLTTVRGYAPFPSFPDQRDSNVLFGMTFFLLNLSLKMRIDKIDGTGHAAWVGDFLVPPVLEGFFEALGIMENDGRLDTGTLRDLNDLLKSLERAELSSLFQPLLSFYGEGDPEDFEMIQAHLAEHIDRLHVAIQRIQR